MLAAAVLAANAGDWAEYYGFGESLGESGASAFSFSDEDGTAREMLAVKPHSDHGTVRPEYRFTYREDGREGIMADAVSPEIRPDREMEGFMEVPSENGSVFFHSGARYRAPEAGVTHFKALDE